TICTSFFFSSRRRHTRSKRDWSSDVCSSDLPFAGRRPGLDDQVVSRAAEAIAGANRPLVIAGGGARRAHAEVKRFVELIDSPLEIGRASCRERPSTRATGETKQTAKKRKECT